MSKRKRYSPEYKRELVELVRRSQSSCRQIALEVGINPNLLTRWCASPTPRTRAPGGASCIGLGKRRVSGMHQKVLNPSG